MSYQWAVGIRHSSEAMRKSRVTSGIRFIVCILAVMSICSSKTRAATPSALTTPDSQPKATVTYFYTPGCPGCNEIRGSLEKAQRRHPGVDLVALNLADPKNVDKLNAMYDQFHVPYERWNGRLAVFVGKDCFTTEKEVQSSIDSAIAKAIGTRVPSRSPSDSSKIGRYLFHHFKSLGIGTILVAGLLDGLEPCAMATLILFVSYITYVGRKQREIWIIGSTFTVGVFIAYLAMGLGLLRAIQLAQRFESVSRASFAVVAIFAFTMSAMSFYDYRKARAGEFKQMMRQLPGFLKKKIHQTIRYQSKTRNMALAALFVGMVVAVLEMPCTGEIYIPTLTYVMSVPEYREKALYYLVIYSIMFSVPLFLVFLAVGFGFRSQKLAELSQKHTATTKLVLSIFFLLIGLLLAVQTARVYGLIG